LTLAKVPSPIVRPTSYFPTFLVTFFIIINYNYDQLILSFLFALNYRIFKTAWINFCVWLQWEEWIFYNKNKIKIGMNATNGSKYTYSGENRILPGNGTAGSCGVFFGDFF
jgi:hypothetical protein